MFKPIAGFIKSSSRERQVAEQNKEKEALLNRENEKQKEQKKLIRLKALRLAKENAIDNE